MLVEKRVDLAKEAAHLVRLYTDAQEAARPVDVRVALAKFDGAAEALDRLGLLTFTPTGVRLALMDALKEAGPRPGMSAMNHYRKDWDAKMITLVLAGLGWSE
jgi:hypothetical protein